MTQKTTAGLYGLWEGRSNRDFSKKKCWGKNIFNSSFPAALACYMSDGNVDPVYIHAGADGKVVHSKKPFAELLGIDLTAGGTFFNFESVYPPYQEFFRGEAEKIDLVLTDKAAGKAAAALEIKLTALPDSTTKAKKDERDWGTELVVRPPTVAFLACSFCSSYRTPEDRARLNDMLNAVPQGKIGEGKESAAERHYDGIEKAIGAVAADVVGMDGKTAEDGFLLGQKPLILQPIWKTKAEIPVLEDKCLDAFVWSDAALLKMCMAARSGKPSADKKINRFQRTVVWLYYMLKDYADRKSFDYRDIMRSLSFGLANDKAFSVPGNSANEFLPKDYLAAPRLDKFTFGKIITGGGQNYLQPERRLDAALVNAPELFIAGTAIKD